MYDINFQSTSDISPEVQTTIEASLSFTTTSVLLSTFQTSTIESTLKDHPTSSSFITIESIPPNVAYQSTLETPSTTLSLCKFFFINSHFLFCNCIIWFSLNDVYQTHLEEDESDLLKQSILNFCADLVSRVPVFLSTERFT